MDLIVLDDTEIIEKVEKVDDDFDKYVKEKLRSLKKKNKN